VSLDLFGGRLIHDVAGAWSWCGLAAESVCRWAGRCLPQ